LVSDWSSDVCSSDLHEPSGVVIQRFSRGVGIGGRICGDSENVNRI